MKKLVTTSCILALLAGCSSVRMNDGRQVVVQHEWPTQPAEVLEIAKASCGEAGWKGAVLQRTAQMMPGAPAWLSKSVSTFACEN